MRCYWLKVTSVGNSATSRYSGLSRSIKYVRQPSRDILKKANRTSAIYRLSCMEFMHEMLRSLSKKVVNNEILILLILK